MWDLVPWRKPHLHADQGWSVAPGTHEGRPTCHECQPQWCSLAQRGICWDDRDPKNSEDLGISWIVVSVTSGTSVVFLVPRYSIQGGSSSRGAESCSRPVAPRWRHVWGLRCFLTRQGNVATGTYPKTTSVQICIQHHPTSRSTCGP